MGMYMLDIEVIGVFSLDAPTLDIWADGVLYSSYLLSTSKTNISENISFSGSIPVSLELRFDDAMAEAGRLIDIRSVQINDRYVNTGNFLSSNSLSQGTAATIDTASSGFLFDSSEPDPSVFSPVTSTLTTNRDFFRDFGGSNQVLDGLAGNDTIYVGAGTDKITGGLGIDLIRGGAGDDLLYGAEGNDRLWGQDGDDLLYGGAGDDRIQGNAGHDEIHGNDGDDRISAHDGNDILTGGDGNDSLNGGSGDDIIFGDAGLDKISAGAGNDTIDAGSENDIVYGGSGDDIINGGSGDDILVGNKGNDTIHGDAGNDIVYSGSEDIFSSVITNILTSNTGVTYNTATNSFYKYVNSAVVWSVAENSAPTVSLMGLTGVSGHLVTVTSQTENDAVSALIGNNTVWISASDDGVEGEWIWTSGPEAGQKFWSGGFLGSPHNSLYSNWGTAEPNDFSTGEDYAEFFGNSGLWNDDGGPSDPGTINRYVIEWEATSLIDSNDQTFMNGGEGNDSLYGSNGLDVFILDNLTSIDTLYNFNTDAAKRDQIDMSDIISGYDPLLDDLTDFIQLTEFGGDTYVSVDSNGTAGGSSFQNIAIIESITGLDLNVMIAGDNLIV